MLALFLAPFLFQDAAARVTRPPIARSPIALHRAADLALVEARFEQARETFARALEEDPHNAALAYGRACATARMGAREEALDWLERATEQDYADPQVARWDPDLESLRDSQRFAQAVDAMELSRSERVADDRWTVLVPAAGFVRTGIGRSDPTGRLIAVPMKATNTLRLIEASTGRVHLDIAGHDASLLACSFAPDGESVASLDTRSTWRRWEVASGSLLASARTAQVERPTEVALIAWLAGGERLITSCAGRTRLWTLAGALVAELVRPPRTRAQAWNHAASFVAIGGEQLFLFDARTGARILAGPEVEGAVHGLAVSDDGTLLAVGQGRGRIEVFETSSWRRLWRDTAIDPDSDREAGIDIWGDELHVPVLCFSPDGRWLASCTVSGRFVNLHGARTGELAWRSKHLGGHMGTSMPVACDDRFVYGDGVKHRWAIATGKRLEPLDKLGVPGKVEATAGQWTLISNGAGQLACFDPASEQVLYQRTELTNDEFLLYHPTGWFAGSISDLAKVRLLRSRYVVPRSRALPPERFDPKRLRAAQAGVALTPAAP